MTYLETDILPVSAGGLVQVVDDALEAGALAGVHLVVLHPVKHSPEN